MRRIKQHTVTKLEFLKKYLNAYLSAAKKLPKKYYIDAFAGTGKNVLCNIKECKSKGGEKCTKCGKGTITDGSALISIKLEKKFTKYLIVEMIDNNFNELKSRIQKGIDHNTYLKIKLLQNDANKILINLHKYTSPYHGFVIFLDPEGPELYWETIKYLSKIPKTELLILYPYDMSLVRLTTKEHSNKLDRFYGGSQWFKIYHSGINAQDRKKKLLDFYIGNLKALGFKYVTYKQIKTRLRDGKALYHIIHTTHHPVGKKIMKDIFNKELDGQTKMKF